MKLKRRAIQYDVPNPPSRSTCHPDQIKTWLSNTPHPSRFLLVYGGVLSRKELTHPGAILRRCSPNTIWCQNPFWHSSFVAANSNGGGAVYVSEPLSDIKSKIRCSLKGSYIDLEKQHATTTSFYGRLMLAHIV